MPFSVLSSATAAAAPVTTLGAPKISIGLTLNDMQAELDSRLGGRADVLSDRLALWINLAYTDICTSLELDELRGSLDISLVADQPIYMLPYVVNTIIGAALVLPETDNVNGGYPLNKSDLSAYRSLPAEFGDPEIYFRMNNLLIVWPTPSSGRTLAVDTRIRPAWLVALTDSPVLGVEWHEGILLLARSKAHASLKEYDFSIAAANEFTAFMRRRTDREAQEESGRIVGSSVPRRVEDIRNRVVSRGLGRGY